MGLRCFSRFSKWSKVEKSRKFFFPKFTFYISFDASQPAELEYLYLIFCLIGDLINKLDCYLINDPATT